MKQAALTWDPSTLDAYLADPAKLVPGNRMPFPGLKTDHDRQDVIAFLAAAAAPAGVPLAKAAAPQAKSGSAAAYSAYFTDAKYTLRTGIAEGKMVFLGVGGSIDGKANPVLTAAEGQIVQLTLINGEGTEHDIVFPDQDAKSPRVNGKGASTTIVFRAAKSGDFLYFCSVPGHRLAGMEGQLLVTPTAAPQALVEADVSREPTDLPPPIGKRDPKSVRLDLFTVEQEGRLAEATTLGYWTFNGKVPGPFVRVRVGDTVDVHLKNSPDSNMIHSVDFHAATGPGGGAAALQVDPGAEKSMTFKALIPGLYVYHCATPMVAEHIANGMYGLILVEPEAGLPPVDHEFYVMQGEVYAEAAFGQHGSQEFSVEKLLNERPEYFVFNGSVGAISKLHPLHTKVGETVRLFFGVGGPNFTSSFHVIGEIFDKVYNLGGLTNPPQEGIQTVTVAPGDAVITEFKLHVPGNYAIVDHALARMERGLAGLLIVQGAPNPDIYNGTVMPGMGH
jgi:nitrite reductase (NO-forming)